MALTKPILYSLSAFDATVEQKFFFNVIGGNQVVANELFVIDQATQEIKYQHKQDTYSFEHSVPADSLENGTYYSAYIKTYDAEAEVSESSNPIQFYCYSYPTFEIDNIPVSHIIENSSFSFNLHYAQTEEEQLNTYSFSLFDSQGIEIANSGTLFVGNAEQPNDFGYVFSGFSNNTAYMIQAHGQTSGGTIVDTDIIEFTVQYTKPEMFSVVELDNNCEEGYVIVKSNVLSITGTSFPSPPIYVDDNTAVDARESGSYVRWEQGYQLSGDFTMAVWGKNFTQDTRIIHLTNALGDTISIHYRKNNDKVYADCSVVNREKGLYHYVYSDSIDEPSSTKQLQIWLRRVGGLYDIKLAVAN